MQHTQTLYPDADGVLTPHPLGLVECTNDEYHAGPGISKSHLDTIHGASPKHYWQRYLNPDRIREEKTPALLLGSAIHAVILQPDLFTAEYVPNPGIERRSNAGKAELASFISENAGKVILSDDDYQKCLAIRDVVHKHPVVSNLLRGGVSEQAVYAIDPETGELIKCQIDYMVGSLILDVKTTEDASPAGFGKSSANYRYPHQTAWYWDVLDAAFGEHPEYWAFLAIEKNPPYAMGLYYPDPQQIALARTANCRDFLRIVEHKRSGQWPDYATEALPLQLPGWWKP